MKIREGFLLRKFADKYIAVTVGDAADERNVLITLNGSGAYVWELLQEDVSYDFVIERLLDKYDIDRATAVGDFDAFLAKARKADLIDD